MNHFFGVTLQPTLHWLLQFVSHWAMAVVYFFAAQECCENCYCEGDLWPHLLFKKLRREIEPSTRCRIYEYKELECKVSTVMCLPGHCQCDHVATPNPKSNVLNFTHSYLVTLLKTGKCYIFLQVWTGVSQFVQQELEQWRNTAGCKSWSRCMLPLAAQICLLFLSVRDYMNCIWNVPDMLFSGSNIMTHCKILIKLSSLMITLW